MNLAPHMAGSSEAKARLKMMKRRAGQTQAAVGHMPFPGHRTVETIWKQQAAAKRCKRKMEYGFDPESLKAAAK